MWTKFGVSTWITSFSLRRRLNHRNHQDETRRASSYHSYSQSPPYDYPYEERRYGKQVPALTKKPGSDRGIMRFLSTSRLSDHVQEDRFANEVVNARLSDYSLTNGGDLFRSSMQSPRSLSRSSGSEIFDGFDLFNVPNPQQFATSASFVEPGELDGLNVSSAPNPSHSVTSTPSVAPEKFDGLNLFSAPNLPRFATSASFAESGMSDGLGLFSGQNLPQSVTSGTFGELGKFDGLDLFSSPNLPQSVTSAPFSEPGKFDGLELFSAPNPAQSATSAPIAEPGKFDGLDLFEILAASSASVASTLSVDQEFKAFEPSDLFTVMPHQQSTDMMTPKNEGWATFDTPLQSQPTHQDPIVANPFLAWELSEDGAQSHGLDIKSCNPFVLPGDADLESSNMLFDMSYMQSVLPNYNMPLAPGDSQDALVYMAGQATSMQILSIQAQGPVASVGGSPFA
ncbi:uncharacterized protein LOC143564174 [Bidens hawaiensis]|uniref:uncharacterized protein LOC143564174 n=1 Tax=Bidens hawaiensis TaxID=980011 RepID=UPI00404A8F70